MCAILLGLTVMPGGRVVEVGSDVELGEALGRLKAGTTLRIAPGQYRGGLMVCGVEGLVVEGADPERPPEFVGGTNTWKFSRCDDGGDCAAAFTGMDGAVFERYVAVNPSHCFPSSTQSSEVCLADWPIWRIIDAAMIECLPAIRHAIREATGRVVTAAPEPVGGGCIHRAFRIGTFFVKINRRDYAAMFKAETDGLRAITATRTIRVPEPIATGSDTQSAFLVLEWLDLSGAGDDADLGGQLAAMHRHLGQKHGWKRDNFIGSTPQSNAPAENWAEFFRDCRLAPMFRLLAGRGIHIPGADELLERVTSLLAGVNVRPSLLHGDLWGGNAGFLRDGTPVIYDPALYHGHHEADLAMTRLFGGFGSRFYHAHRAVFPSEPGIEQRTALYNLYHILNHALLFGGGYTGQARNVVRSLI